MGLRERVAGAWRELSAASAGEDVRRKTAVLPGVLSPWRPAGVSAQMPKPTAANLRRFAEMPLARRAINVVKDRIASMDWQVRLKRDAEVRHPTHDEKRVMGGAPNVAGDPATADFSASASVEMTYVAGGPDLRVLRRCFEAPNPGDSFRTLVEQVIEDVLVGGFGAIEMELTGDADAPFRLWPVDGATIQVDGTWSGDATEPRAGVDPVQRSVCK